MHHSGSCAKFLTSGVIGPGSFWLLVPLIPDCDDFCIYDPGWRCSKMGRSMLMYSVVDKNDQAQQRTTRKIHKAQNPMSTPRFPFLSKFAFFLHVSFSPVLVTSTFTEPPLRRSGNMRGIERCNILLQRRGMFPIGVRDALSGERE